MGAGVLALEKLQAGIESSPGALVAADMVIVAENGGQFQPQIARQLIEDNHGVLADVDSIDVSKGSLLTYAHNLDLEQVLLPFLCGLKTVSAVGGDDPYTWTFLPTLTAPDALDTATFEISVTDGSTRHLEREFGYGVVTGFTITGGFGQPARITVNVMGRKSQTSSFTAAQSALTRTKIPSSLFGLYIDSAWADLGTTLISGILRSWTLTVDTGVGALETMEERADQDFSGLTRGKIRMTLDMTLAYAAEADTEFDAWEANTKRFASLEAVSGSHSFKAQGHFEYRDPPSFGTDGPLRTVQLVGHAIQDAVSGNAINFEVINALAAF